MVPETESQLTKDRRALRVQYKRIDDLATNPRNARSHSKAQIRQIAESIRVFDFNNPILVDGNGVIVAGHGRVAAAKLLGMREVPTICLENLSEDQIRAYVLADNKLAEKAGWDRDILAIELEYLLTIQDDLDITVTGFEIAEIDSILEDASPEDKSEEELPASEGPISEIGSLWTLGSHKLLCGSALSNSSYVDLLGRKRADAVITDPPFNCKIDGHATGNGAIKHREFAMASGEMSRQEFQSFLMNALTLMSKYSNAAALQFIFMDWRNLQDLSSVGDQVYDSLLNLCIWVKHSGGMGSLYRSQHELIFVYRNAKGSHRNNVQLGKYGRNRTNIWNYPGANSAGRQGEEGNLSALHPTVKPVALIADAILDCTARGDLVLDPFLGSGTTLIAAERVGRVCYAMELDPIYVDLAVRRWQKYTGQAAIDTSTGKTFDELVQDCEVKIG